MLHQIASHGLIDLEVNAVGDWEIDDHHTNEDVGITLGQALAQALSDRDRHFYRILGLTPEASSTEIKKAYRNLAKQWHPDRFVGDPRMQRQAREKFHKINEAYQALRSP